ncbi:MAG: hypothetical protein DRP29_02955 [Thermodesulfobacteriota bacterium]|nr:MAG: hypothetical protein DRP29_02955 [Thermodesulfobacteriota bacterium]
MNWDIFNLVKWLFNEHGAEVLDVVVLILLVAMRTRLECVEKRVRVLESKIDKVFELLVERADKE